MRREVASTRLLVGTDAVRREVSSMRKRQPLARRGAYRWPAYHLRKAAGRWLQPRRLLTEHLEMRGRWQVHMNRLANARAHRHTCADLA
jgi:hypothetical protein